MIFSNLPVDPAALPQVAHLELKPLPQTYRRLLLTEWALRSVFLLLGTALPFVLIDKWQHPLAIGITASVLALLLLWLLLLVLLEFPVLAYALREHDVVYRKGWFFRSLRITPFNRIQNCSVARGPLERSFGLATLVLYTAGSMGADLRISGLPLEEANAIQEYLLKHIHGNEAHPA